MIMTIILWCFSWSLGEAWRAQDYDPKQYHLYYRNQSMHALDRVLLSMRTYYDDGVIRVGEVTHHRLMYEDSAQYEAGYIFGEIIERYKKMVEQVRYGHLNANRTHKSIPNHFMEMVARLDTVQTLYFEIYHLVRMLHEIPQKYKKELLLQPPDALPIKGLSELELAAILTAELEQKRRDKKAGIKSPKGPKGDGKGGFVLGGGTRSTTRSTTKRYNMWWPLDYGWEIGFKGW